MPRTKAVFTQLWADRYKLHQSAFFQIVLVDGRRRLGKFGRVRNASKMHLLVTCHLVKTKNELSWSSENVFKFWVRRLNKFSIIAVEQLPIRIHTTFGG